jgi:hypothetical protein
MLHKSLLTSLLKREAKGDVVDPVDSISSTFRGTAVISMKRE